MKNYTQKGVKKGMLVVFVLAILVGPKITLGAVPSATVKVVVNVVNNNGGTDTPASFGVHVTGIGATPSSFSGSSSGTNVTINAGAPYTISVPTLSYVSSFSPDCNSTLAVNDNVTCTITLDDVAPLLPGQNPENLVQNPLLETPSADPTIPDKWNKGYNDPLNVVTYTYPVTDAPASDISSGNAAKIVATSFAGGADAKWYFNPIPVSAGHQYNFSDSYISTTTTDIVASFCTDTFQSNCTYDFHYSVPATAPNMWKQSSVIFTVPDGKSYMTVFHRISTPGTLIVDNYSLSIVPPPSPFSYGFVSLTFDDGLLSQWDNARNVLLTSGIKGTFYLISHLISGFSIGNPSLEDATLSNPTGWAHSGSNSATYTYSSDAHTGTRSVQVASTTAGSNAAWYFTPISILPDSVYSFSEFYKSTSTANSELVAQVTMNNDTIQTAEVTDITGASSLGSSVALSPSSTYKATEAYFYVPDNAKSITVLNRLTGIGSLTIDDVSLGRTGHFTGANASSLQTDGNEMGGHTQTHPDLTTLTTDVVHSEIDGGRHDLLNNLMAPVLAFAYPYGTYNQAIQQEVQNAGYISARTVIPGFNGMDTPRYSLFSQSVNASTTIDQVKSWVDEARADKTWLILTFHDVESDLTNLPYGTTPQNLTDIISYVKTQSVPVKTMAEGAALMGFTPPPVDICPNVTGIQTTGPCADALCLSPNTWNNANQTCDAPIVIPPTDLCPNVTGTQTTLPCADSLCLSPNTWNNGTQHCDVPVVVPPTDVCPNVTGIQTTGPCTDSLCLSPNTWNTTTQTCDAPVVPTTPNPTPNPIISTTLMTGSIPKLPNQGKVLGAEKFIFTKWLKIGSRGNEVTELQKFLTTAGYYNGLIDGIFGQKTKDALKKFQFVNGLNEDGIVGPLTRAVLNK